jgi:predicted secreted protein
MSFINAESIKVFISYSHDSPEHLERVLRLSNRLRRDGIDCLIDQYEMSPREGWPRWTMSQIEEARFVLVVCTETYHRRVRGKEETGKGLGAKWEGAIITQELYDSEANNDKFIPVLFASEDVAHVPVYLRGVTRYVLDDDYENLYRRITNQPKHLKPALGTRRSMPPLDRKEDFLPMPESGASGQLAGVGGATPAADPSLKPSPNTDQPSKPPSDEKPNPPTEAPSRLRASWIFGALLLVFLVYAYRFSPDTLPEYKQRILAFACALIAGLFGFFLTGDIGLEIHSARSRIGTLNIKATAGFAAFVLMLLWWFSPLAPVKPGPEPPKKTESDPIAIYRVRVTVLDPQQSPVNDADIQSSASGERKKVDGVWEIDITAANKPADGKVTIYAAKSGASLCGNETLVLDKDPNPAIKIQLYQCSSLNPPNPGIGGSPAKPTPIAIYRVRVSVIDLEQTLVEEAEIRSLPSGEVKKVSGGWEIDISAANKPANGVISIYVSKPSAFLKGQANLRLDKDPNPTVEIHLRSDTSARVKGKVMDSGGQAIAGAWVNVIGYERERVKTGPGGEFDLPAHKAEGQSVRLHAEMEGYTPEDQHHLAGSHPATIILRRR